MAFQVSPGVNVSEIDASTSIPAVSTNVGAVVGRFAKGPVSEIVEVSNEEELLNTFGAPDDTNYKSWFTASNFLAYSNSLKVVRVVDDNSSTPSNKARNALSGKVTATAAASGAEQSFRGQAESTTIIHGSSAQEFFVNVTAAIGTDHNLHTGLNTTVGGGGTDQFLQPRSSTALDASANDNGYTLVAPAASASGDVPIRSLLGSDVTVFIRNSGESTGGLLPANRYSVSGQEISFSSNHGDLTSSGPYYVYHHGATGQRLVTSGTVATAMSSGFTYPLYTRQSVANLADSGVYGGDGASHVHYFTSYGQDVASISTGSDTITLNSNHGLVQGDAVVYHSTANAVAPATSEIGLNDNTVYYVKSIAGDVVTLSDTYDYAAETGGTTTTITGSISAATHSLYKAFYMPSSMTAANHSKTVAPSELGIKPYAGLVDRVTIKVAAQTVFELKREPGSYAVNNNSVVSIQSGSPDDAAGTTDSDLNHSTSDYSVTANSKVISYSVNLPRTGQLETITVPRQKSFTLSPPVNLANGETVEVKVDDVVMPVGTATGPVSYTHLTLPTTPYV